MMARGSGVKKAGGGPANTLDDIQRGDRGAII
jgi:hypothetical protein